jgi:hypothetical protein
MPDIFAVLAADHERVRRLLAEVQELIGADHSATMVDQERKQSVTERLIIAESQHEAAEEIAFWPMVRAKVPDGDALASAGVGQEQHAKESLDTIRRASPDFIDIDRLLADTVAAGRAHIAFEEQEVWPKLRVALTDEEAQHMAEDFLAHKEKAPTRPHPTTPPDPTVLRTMGSAAAVVDRLRDKVTGRGEGGPAEG